MRQEEIIRLAQSTKERFNTIDTFKICKELDISISFTKLKPNIYPAYILRIGKTPAIVLNENFTLTSQKVLCAHELGHALMHKDKIMNQFNDNHNGIYEYEANLFAVALLFNQEDLCVDICKMDNCLLKSLLNNNIHLRK
ncbi:MAG: ImmA/IrrE family metallo-endopeptidase [Clostridium lundense]|nr:ImmA/IrrE family metallo-endopeptidase [Clostridium lundense]